jgi:hypothetical protein
MSYRSAPIAVVQMPIYTFPILVQGRVNTVGGNTKCLRLYVAPRFVLETLQTHYNPVTAS